MGACITALNDGGRDEKLSNWSDKTLSDSSENTVAIQGEKVASLEGENDSTKLSTWKEPKPVKSRKGGGDTKTTGKHSTRYNAYLKAVKTGKIKPTIYSLMKYKIDGIGLGVETARGFLSEMEKSGLLEKLNINGKNSYRLAIGTKA